MKAPDPSQHPILQACGLSVTAAGATILAGIDLAVARGEFIAVVGPNGAGKSTLLRALRGMQRATCGSVRLAGRELEDFRPRELARRISYLPQLVDLELPFTVRDFVTMGRYAWPQDDDDMVDQALRTAGVVALADRHIGTLSGGERQRVLLAGDLAQNAEVMLLDEVTANLDPQQQDVIAAVLQEVNALGKTIIWVTHDLNQALQAQRILALRDGLVAAFAEPTEFLDQHLFDTLFCRRFHHLQHPETGRPVVV